MEEQKFQIIEAAGKLLTVFGVKGLTIKTLVEEMKIPESAIYKHFDNEEEIMVALLDYMAGDMDDRFKKAISPDQDPEAQFIALFQNQFSFAEKHPQMVMAMFSKDLKEISPRLNQNILKNIAVITKHLEPIILKGQQSKLFTTVVDTRNLTHIIIRTFHLQMQKWQATDFRFDIKYYGNNMIESILGLIETEKH